MTPNELEALAEEVLEKSAATAGQQGEAGFKLWKANRAREEAEKEISELPRGMHHGRSSSFGPSVKKKSVRDRIREVGSAARRHARGAGAAARRAGQAAVATAKKHPKATAAAAATTAVGGAVAAHHMRKKASIDLEALAQEVLDSME